MSRTRSTAALFVIVLLALSLSLTGCGGGDEAAPPAVNPPIGTADGMVNPSTAPAAPAEVPAATLAELTGHEQILAKGLRLPEAPITKVDSEKGGDATPTPYVPRYWQRTAWHSLAGFSNRRFVGPTGSYYADMLSQVLAKGGGAITAVYDDLGRRIPQQSLGVWGFNSPSLYTFKVAMAGMPAQVFTLEVGSTNNPAKVMRVLAIDPNTNKEFPIKAGWYQIEVGKKVLFLPAWFNPFTGARVPAPAGQTSNIYGGYGDSPVRLLNAPLFQATSLGNDRISISSIDYNNTRSWFYSTCRVTVVTPKLLFQNAAGFTPVLQARTSATSEWMNLTRSSAGYLTGSPGWTYNFDISPVEPEIYIRIGYLMSGFITASEPNTKNWTFEAGWYKITFQVPSLNTNMQPFETLWVTEGRGSSAR